MEFASSTPRAQPTPKAITGELSIFVGAKPDIRKGPANTPSDGYEYPPCRRHRRFVRRWKWWITWSLPRPSSSRWGMLLADAMGLSRAKVAEVMKTVHQRRDLWISKYPTLSPIPIPYCSHCVQYDQDLGCAPTNWKIRQTPPYLEKAIELHCGSDSWHLR